ncbi:MAG: hypothetical protein IJX53_08475 [Clostridia bacterium]|nr:hypothetical protein [Clostridia bacterium]
MQKRVMCLTHQLSLLLCAGLAAASWIFNPGWLRVILFLAAVIHTLIFAAIHISAAMCLEKSRLLHILLWVDYIPYLAVYLLLPDFGDLGEVHMLFGMICSEVIRTAALGITVLSLLVNLGLMAVILGWEIVIWSGKQDAVRAKLYAWFQN